MRLDRQTGATAFCKPSGEGYACRPTDEAPGAEGGEIARLKDRVAALEAKIAGPAPGEAVPKPGSRSSEEGVLRLPSQEEVDRVAGFLERTMRRFKKFAEDLQRDDEAERERL
jgi:hypothetical protein